MRDPIPTSWGRGAPNREGGGGYARGCWGPPSPELWGMQHGDISLPPFLPPPYFALWRNFLIFGERGCWAVPSGSAISSSTTWLLEEPYIQQAVGTGRFVALLRCFSASPPPPLPGLVWFSFAGSACKVVPKTRCNPRAAELGNLWSDVFWWRAVCSHPAAPGEGICKIDK